MNYFILKQKGKSSQKLIMRNSQNYNYFKTEKTNEKNNYRLDFINFFNLQY